MHCEKIGGSRGFDPPYAELDHVVTQGQIELRGVAVNNLRHVDLDLPHHRLIVFCGVSGSGKTSMALDTLYAEGQRRYIESFSPYTRQFLEQLDKAARTGRPLERPRKSTIT
jgi:hypothetical protein